MLIPDVAEPVKLATMYVLAATVPPDNNWPTAIVPADRVHVRIVPVMDAVVTLAKAAAAVDCVKLVVPRYVADMLSWVPLIIDDT